MTTVYEAINLAADHIERNPHLYSYVGAVFVPSSDEDYGCLIGWSAFFLGIKAGTICGSYYADDSQRNACSEMLGISFADFQDRMLNVLKPPGGSITNAKWGAEALRLYAAKYHAPEKTKKVTRQEIPEEIRAIFDRVYTAMDLTV